jgi:hypothetical protein
VRTVITLRGSEAPEGQRTTKSADGRRWTAK